MEVPGDGSLETSLITADLELYFEIIQNFYYQARPNNIFLESIQILFSIFSERAGWRAVRKVNASQSCSQCSSPEPARSSHQPHPHPPSACHHPAPLFMYTTSTISYPLTPPFKHCLLCTVSLHSVPCISTTH